MPTRPRGPLNGWQPTTTRQRAILADLTARYQQHDREDTLPRSGRGIFYDLRPAGLGHGVTYAKGAPGPMRANPAVVQEVLVLARRSGIIPERWVADARAPDPITVASYDDADDFARLVAAEARAFRLDPQRGQPVHVEVWCEAEDLAPRLARVAGPYGVPVYAGGGYGGLKGRRQLADRALAREVPTRVGVITDLDRDGLHIFQSAAEDAAAWAAADGAPNGWLAFERLAVTADQARARDVLDPDGTAEADALPVPVLDAIMVDWLNRVLLPAGRERLAAEQEAERRRLPDATLAALLDQAREGRPAAAVAGWAVTSRPGRVWLHPAWPGADGDLTPDAAETLAAALLRAVVEARRAPARSWTPSNQGR